MCNRVGTSSWMDRNSVHNAILGNFCYFRGILILIIFSCFDYYFCIFSVNFNCSFVLCATVIYISFCIFYIYTLGM